MGERVPPTVLVLAMFPFTGYGFVSLLYHIATERNQHQLPTCKTSKWHSLLFEKTTIFELSPKT